MDSAKFGPRERNHTACAVELHGAASQSNHAVDKADIL